MTDLERRAEVAYGALVEIGRRDLANLLQWFPDDVGGWYLEADADEVGEADWALMVKADGIGRGA